MMRALCVAPQYSPAATDRPIAPRVLNAETSFLMSSMLQDVIRKGAAKAALFVRRVEAGAGSPLGLSPGDIPVSGVASEVLNNARKNLF